MNTTIVKALARSGLSTEVGTVRLWVIKKASSAPRTPMIAPDAPTLTRTGDAAILAIAPPIPAAR